MNFTVTVQGATETLGERAGVLAFLPERGSFVVVTVHGPTTTFDGVSVDCSGVGTCLGADSLVFSELLKFCTEFGSTLLGPRG